MSSFFRNRQSRMIPSNTELVMSEYKKSVKQKLVEAIKDLQIEYSDGNQTVIVSNNELSNQLVCALEALFIHGMKGSFIGKISSAVFGGGVTSGASDTAPYSPTASSASSKLPEPNFWMFVLVFSHRDTIQSIEKLPQVTSDVGRGRSWLRLALNDGLLGAYLQAMQKDRLTAQKFYQRYAILRDPELLDVITKYICGIEHYRFDLALNSSMLNRWQTAPLILAGLWTPNVVPTQAPAFVQVAVDAATTLDEEGIDPLATSSPGPIPSAPSGMQYLSRGLLNEDEALKLILQGRSYGSGSSSAADSPVGTPASSSGIAVRVMNRNDAKKQQSVRKSQLQSKDLSPRTQDNPPEESKVDANISAATDDTQNDSLYVTALVDNSSCDTTVETDATAVQDTTASDSEEVEVSIYSMNRKSLQEDASSFADSATGVWATASTTPSFSPVKDAPAVTKEEDIVEEKIDNEVDDNEKNNNNEIVLKLSEQSQVASDVPPAIVVKPIHRRRQLVSGGSSTSSRESGTSGFFLNLAVPHLAGFIDSWNPFGSGRFFDTPPEAKENERFGFTLKPEVRVGALNEASSQALMQLFDRVVREEGLDAQNYECVDCSKAIGTLFGPAKVCAYTKLYYCDECHVDELSVIPSKIVYSWNFKTFKVCRKAKVFLDSINIEPIIDVKTFNAALFEFAPDLNEIYTLRKQLKYMNAYLMTCNAGGSKTKEAFSRLLWPRAYIHEDVDMYSIQDLEEIRSGKLKSLLGHASRLCREHILTCLLCQGKGFICEVCRDSNPVYPFDLESITQCPKCYTVFHLECSATLTNCPKCDRIEARNLNWHISEAKLARQHGSSSNELSAVECS